MKKSLCGPPCVKVPFYLQEQSRPGVSLLSVVTFALIYGAFGGQGLFTALLLLSMKTLTEFMPNNT